MMIFTHFKERGGRALRWPAGGGSDRFWLKTRLFFIF
jgi:hypothetical protein